MIHIKNLSKIYVSNKKNKVKALDNVTFSLPNKGMVFICGKSGSGKSTLLNLIAGLDEITSGDIIVDGNSLKKLKPSYFNDFRNRYIGFIFQDFCLLDTFNIKDNVALSLNLLGEENEDRIKDILKEVDLEGYETRFPKELSGGQKQRVAIARALIKNPKYILADEPTGNLDSETSTQILKLLKKLSKDKLVLIISHSKENAYEYGDRIIELKDGKICKDISRKNEEEKLIDEDTIYIPVNKKLTEDELVEVNEKLKTGKYNISQKDNLYIDTIQPTDVGVDEELKKTTLISLKSLFLLSKGFTKNYHLNLMFTSIMVSLLVIIMVITQVFTAFNGNYLIENAMGENTTEFVLYKGFYPNQLSPTISKKYLVPVFEDEVDKFYDNGYEGKIYKLYSTGLVADPSGDRNHAYAYSLQVDYSTLTSPFVDIGKGVLECDLEYLEKIYGVDGKLDVLYGTLENTNKCELVITDYFADCLLRYRGYNPQTVINTERIIMSLSAYNVKAIINTNYRTRYEVLLNKFAEIEAVDSLQEKNKLFEELQNSDEFLKFYNELNNTLAIGYFIDGNYLEALKKDTSVSKGSWGKQPKFYYEDGTFMGGNMTVGRELDTSLKEGEIIINSNLLEQLVSVGTEDLINNFKPFKIILEENYEYASKYDEPLIKKELTVVGIKKSTSPHISMSYEDYYEYYKNEVFTCALYFDNPQSAASIYNPVADDLYFSTDKYIDGVYTIMNIILIFNDFFKLITLAITVVCIVMLISFGRKSIKRRMFEIGVIRALGCKNREVYLVILSQIIYMCIIVSLISSVSLIFLDDYINSILIENIVFFMKNNAIKDLLIFELNPTLITINLVGIFALTFICSTTLMLTLRKIKPINIIRKRDE